MSTWLETKLNDPSLGPRNHFEPHCVAATDKKNTVRHHRLDLVALDAYDDEQMRPHENAPASPAAAAEDIFVEFVNWLFDNPEHLLVRRGDNAHLQDIEPQPFSTLDRTPTLEAYLVRPFDRYLGDVTLPASARKIADATEPNFWLRVRDPQHS